MSRTNFANSILNYGPTFPGGYVPDGTLFYLTTGAKGLYMYSFSTDISAGIPGDQVGQGWLMLANTGPVNADTLDTYDSTAFQFVDADLTALTALSDTTGFGLYVRTGVGSSTTRSIVGGGGITVTNGAGIFGNISLSVDASAISLASLDGVLPVAKGGTNSTAVTVGGVLYGATGTVISSTVAGGAGQVLRSNGAGAPTWGSNSITLGTTSVSLGGTATILNGFTQITANTFVGTLSGNASSADTADEALDVLWTNVSGRPTFWFNFGNTGAASPIPTTFASNSVNGFSAYSCADFPGSYWTGLQVNGPGGIYSAQLAMNWNSEEASPNGLIFRVNDDTSNVNSWSAWTVILNAQNFNTYAPTLIGDGASGTWNIDILGTSANTNSISNAVGNSYNWPSSQTINGVVSRNPASVGFGYIRLSPGDAAHTGLIEFMPYALVGRQGYIGYSTSQSGLDSGVINYVAGTHAFTGNMTVNGTIVATGDVVAYSDRKLKTDIETIRDPIQIVQALRGVSYTRIDTNKKSVGVIAQETREVLPEVVLEAEDGTLGVSYGNIVGVLIEAIKEQQKQIDALRAEVQVLKG